MKKNILMMTALIMISVGASNKANSEEDICVLTYNSNIWKSMPIEVSKKFPGFNWQSDDSGYTAGSEDGLRLWKQDVLSAKLAGKTDTTSLNILIYDSEISENVENDVFFKDASTWKTLMDKKMGLKGTVLEKGSAGVNVVQSIAWEFPESVITLTTVAGQSPEKMYIRMLAKSAASSVLAELHKPEKGSAEKEDVAVVEKVSGPNKVLTKLRGKTTYYDGGSFTKQNISKDTEYFLVYYSASW